MTLHQITGYMSNETGRPASKDMEGDGHVTFQGNIPATNRLVTHCNLTVARENSNRFLTEYKPETSSATLY